MEKCSSYFPRLTTTVPYLDTYTILKMPNLGHRPTVDNIWHNIWDQSRDGCLYPSIDGSSNTALLEVAGVNLYQELPYYVFVTTKVASQMIHLKGLYITCRSTQYFSTFIFTLARIFESSRFLWLPIPFKNFWTFQTRVPHSAVTPPSPIIHCHIFLGVSNQSSIRDNFRIMTDTAMEEHWPHCRSFTVLPVVLASPYPLLRNSHFFAKLGQFAEWQEAQVARKIRRSTFSNCLSSKYVSTSFRWLYHHFQLSLSWY